MKPFIPVFRRHQIIRRFPEESNGILIAFLHLKQIGGNRRQHETGRMFLRKSGKLFRQQSGFVVQPQLGEQICGKKR